MVMKFKTYQKRKYWTVETLKLTPEVKRKSVEMNIYDKSKEVK